MLKRWEDGERVSSLLQQMTAVCSNTFIHLLFLSPRHSGNTVPTQQAHSSITYRYERKEGGIVGRSSKESSQRSKVGTIDQWKVHILLTSSSATLWSLAPFWKAQMAQQDGRGRILFLCFCTKGDWMKLTISLSESESDCALPPQKKKKEKPVF